MPGLVPQRDIRGRCLERKQGAIYKNARGAHAGGGLMKRQILSLALAGAFAALSVNAVAAEHE